MKQPYRVVLVGTGGIGDAHVRAVATLPGRVKLVAACDIDAKRAQDFCTRSGIPTAYTDYATMLKTEKPDLVLIAAPPALHADMSIAAMEAGAWVLCEKPLCSSLAELDRIQAAEKKTGKFTASVFQMRFASSNTHVRSLLTKFYTNFHVLMYGVVSIVGCMVFGYLGSLFFPAPTQSLRGLTIFDQVKGGLPIDPAKVRGH